jgi:hypothetical protein
MNINWLHVLCIWYTYKKFALWNRQHNKEFFKLIQNQQYQPSSFCKVKTLQVKINSPINYKASGIGKVQFYSST